jgi:hypothetical protein
VIRTSSGTQWVAECFWPGVQDEDLRDLDRRVAGAVSDLAGRGGEVDYLGTLRITDDEVVLLLFEGSIAVVQQVAERAGIRADRILHCTRISPSTDVPTTRSQP